MPPQRALLFTVQLVFQIRANRGATSAPLHPFQDQGARGGDRIIEKKKKTNSCVMHMLHSSEDCTTAEAWGSEGMSHLNQTQTFPHHLPTSDEREEGQSQTIWIALWEQRPAEKIGLPRCLAQNKAKQLALQSFVEHTHQQLSAGFISMSISND